MSNLLWRRQPRRERQHATRLSLEALERRTAPAIFLVNTFDDTVEHVRDGSGLDEFGNISLRSAIMAANDLGGDHQIVLYEGRYQLTRYPEGLNGDDSGNLNIGHRLTQIGVSIVGISADKTIIDAAYLDQALEVGFFSRLTMTAVTVENGWGTFGGAITNGGTINLARVQIRYSGASHGGGLFNNGTANLSNVTVEGNFASQGGGVHNNGTMTITTSTLRLNYAGGQGGGLFNNNRLTMTRSTVSENFAAEFIGWGGGIFNQSNMTLTNSTFAYNFASTGGAVYTIGFGTASFTNCTIAANVATTSPFSEAGGIYVGIGRHTVQLKNTLVALNWADSNPDVAGEFASLGHNLIGDASGASGFTKTDILGSSEAPIDPRLGPLQDNGGPTHTMALLKGSIAIDAGDSKGAPDVDQRGEFRDDFVDIGAYEFQEE